MTIIPFDFEYYYPDSIEEAVELHAKLASEEKQPLYYGGGTEIITLGRLHRISTKAVIDVKDIPGCHVHKLDDRYYTVGAAVTLTELQERRYFPLLAETAGRIADHTTRNKITLGGNLCGEIIYKEAILPLLVTDSELVIAGVEGLRTVPIDSVFNQELHLSAHECLYQIRTKSHYLNLPYYSVKKRKLEKVDYPLVTLVALKVDEKIRFAVSGVCDFPFRSKEMEAIVNQPTKPLEVKIREAVENLPAPIIDDAQGSREYRRFMLARTLYEAMTKLGGDIGD